MKIQLTVAKCTAGERTLANGTKVPSYTLRLSYNKRIVVDGIAEVKNLQFFRHTSEPIEVGKVLTLDMSNYNVKASITAPSAEYPKGGTFNWLNLKQDAIFASGASVATPAVVTEKGAA